MTINYHYKLDSYIQNQQMELTDHWNRATTRQKHILLGGGQGTSVTDEQRKPLYPGQRLSAGPRSLPSLITVTRFDLWLSCMRWGLIGCWTKKTNRYPIKDWVIDGLGEWPTTRREIDSIYNHPDEQQPNTLKSMGIPRKLENRERQRRRHPRAGNLQIRTASRKMAASRERERADDDE